MRRASKHWTERGLELAAYIGGIDSHKARHNGRELEITIDGWYAVTRKKENVRPTIVTMIPSCKLSSSLFQAIIAATIRPLDVKYEFREASRKALS